MKIESGGRDLKHLKRFQFARLEFLPVRGVDQPGIQLLEEFIIIAGKYNDIGNIPLIRSIGSWGFPDCLRRSYLSLD